MRRNFDHKSKFNRDNTNYCSTRIIPDEEKLGSQVKTHVMHARRQVHLSGGCTKAKHEAATSRHHSTRTCEPGKWPTRCAVLLSAVATFVNLRMSVCRCSCPAKGAELHSLKFSISCCRSCLVRGSDGVTACSSFSRACSRAALR